MLVPDIGWVAWQGDLVVVYDSVVILGEGGEGRLDDEGENTRVEGVDDGATTVLNLLLDQRLVLGGVRLDLAEESLGCHGVRGVRC